MRPSGWAGLGRAGELLGFGCLSGGRSSQSRRENTWVWKQAHALELFRRPGAHCVSHGPKTVYLWALTQNFPKGKDLLSLTYFLKKKTQYPSSGESVMWCSFKLDVFSIYLGMQPEPVSTARSPSFWPGPARRSLGSGWHGTVLQAVLGLHFRPAGRPGPPNNNIV